METCEIKIPSIMLKPGFWIYVVRATATSKPVSFYVGMTGDSSSNNAGSLFSRLSKHLGKNENNNTLLKNLKKYGLRDNLQHLEVVGFHLSEKAENMEEHRKIYKEISNIEDKLHKDLEVAGCKVLGNQWVKKKSVVLEHRKEDYQKIIKLLKKKFGLKL